MLTTCLFLKAHLPTGAFSKYHKRLKKSNSAPYIFSYSTIFMAFSVPHYNPGLWDGRAELKGQLGTSRTTGWDEGRRKADPLSVRARWSGMAMSLSRALSLSKASLLRIKLYQDQIKKCCQYSWCTHKGEKRVRKLFLTVQFYIPLQIEITRSD